ncbi:hypothetical protein ACIRCZ_18560 [Leifsonia sp. NPDC102414]|uniref:hypothetical protein n=1 Tax=Leifsonia sp. NPDC102414 TaxID=3364124 RepID=UPI003821F792
MSRYTPTEILTAGLNDTRETFAHLYVVLDKLRAAAAYNYHRAYVDIDVDSDQPGRLPFHPAPAGFGGNELAIPARKVNLTGLTDAGLQLYIHGVRAAHTGRVQLLEQIETAGHDLERMLIALDGTATTTGARIAHLIDVAERHANYVPTGHHVTGWDVPVRIPGTTTYTTC